MNFPVIVKDTLGAGSIGVEVMNAYEEVESFLNSNRNNSDIMVEELIQGEQFGTEIHGVEGRYSGPSADRLFCNKREHYRSVKFCKIWPGDGSFLSF